VCFVTLEDETGSLDLILWKTVYESFEEILRQSRFLIIEGKVQRENEAVSIIVSKVESLGRIDGVKEKPIRPGEHPRSIR